MPILLMLIFAFAGVCGVGAVCYGRRHQKNSPTLIQYGQLLLAAADPKSCRSLCERMYRLGFVIRTDRLEHRLSGHEANRNVLIKAHTTSCPDCRKTMSQLFVPSSELAETAPAVDYIGAFCDDARCAAFDHRHAGRRSKNFLAGYVLKHGSLKEALNAIERDAALARTFHQMWMSHLEKLERDEQKIERKIAARQASIFGKMHTEAPTYSDDVDMFLLKAERILIQMTMNDIRNGPYGLDTFPTFLLSS